MQKEVLKYHPNRYFHNMETFITEVIEDYYGNHKEQSRKELKGFLLEAIFETKLQLKLSRSSSYNDVIPAEKIYHWGEYKVEIFSAYADYYFSGSNIFHICPNLFERLIKNSEDSINLRNIKLPFENLYIYWGCSPQLRITDNLTIDGSYINVFETNNEYEIFFYLTTYNKEFDYNKKENELKFLFNDTHYYNLFMFENDIAIKDIIKQTLNNDDSIFGGVTLEKFRPVLEKTINILVNSLLFISNHKNEVDDRSFNDSPQKPFRKFNKTSIKSKIPRNRDKATNCNSNNIYYCDTNHEYETISRKVG